MIEMPAFLHKGESSLLVKFPKLDYYTVGLATKMFQAGYQNSKRIKTFLAKVINVRGISYCVQVLYSIKRMSHMSDTPYLTHELARTSRTHVTYQWQCNHSALKTV